MIMEMTTVVTVAQTGSGNQHTAGDRAPTRTRSNRGQNGEMAAVVEELDPEEPDPESGVAGPLPSVRDEGGK